MSLSHISIVVIILCLVAAAAISYGDPHCDVVSGLAEKRAVCLVRVP